MSNKAYLEFEGFNEAIARLNKLNANTKNISEKITLFTDSQISIEKIMSVESDRNPIYKKAFSNFVLST